MNTTLDEEIAAAEQDAFAALDACGPAVTRRAALYKQVSTAAYRAAGGGESGSRAQLDGTARSHAKFLENVARRMRRVGLGGVLDHARGR